MPNFYYNPGVQDRRGEYFAQGLSQAFNSLASGIQQAEQKRKEQKAYAGLAEVLGLDPAHVTKEQVQAAMVKDQILSARRQQQQKTKALQALARIPAVFTAKRQGGPDLAATLALGRGPLAQPVMAPPMDASDAASAALADNPDVFSDAQAATSAINLEKILAAQGSGGVTIDANTGLPVVRSGNSVKVVNPAWLPGGRPQKPTGMSTINIPGLGTLITNNGRQVNPREIVPTAGMGAPASSGRYPKAAKIIKMEGKDVALYPDGSWTPVPNAGAASAVTQDEQEILDAGKRGTSQAGAHSDETDNLPTVTTQEDTNQASETFSKGDRVKQNGQEYEYDGQNWNPVTE